MQFRKGDYCSLCVDSGEGSMEVGTQYIHPTYASTVLSSMLSVRKIADNDLLVWNAERNIRSCMCGVCMPSHCEKMFVHVLGALERNFLPVTFASYPLMPWGFSSGKIFSIFSE